MTDTKKRIQYIDYLKGLTILWVVWYHTSHPAIADFAVRLPLFFFLSGIFFKHDLAGVFARKKLNQLIVPFVFFTLIYFLFLLAEIYRYRGTFLAQDFMLVFEFLRPHTANHGFTVNPPLWFILALIDVQVVTWLLVKLTGGRRLLVVIIAFAIWWWDTNYLFYQPTFLMFGRAMSYLPYFAVGNLYGRSLLGIIEGEGIRRFWPLAVAVACSAIVYLLTYNAENPHIIDIRYQVFFFIAILFLIYLFKAIYRVPLLKPLVYYGRNSYIVLGMHEICLMIFTFLIGFAADTDNVWAGGAITILTILALWPVIELFNRYVPRLVGKEPLFPLKSNSNPSSPCQPQKPESEKSE